MTAQLSRERIEQYLQSAEGSKISDFDSGKLIAVEPDYVIALCRLALAGLDSNPVAYMIGGHYLMHAADPKVDNYASAVPLYAAPPAQVAVPDEMTPKQASRTYGGEVCGYLDGWNACRAAMLKGDKS